MARQYNIPGLSYHLSFVADVEESYVVHWRRNAIYASSSAFVAIAKEAWRIVIYNIAPCQVKFYYLNVKGVSRLT